MEFYSVVRKNETIKPEHKLMEWGEEGDTELRNPHPERQGMGHYSELSISDSERQAIGHYSELSIPDPERQGMGHYSALSIPDPERWGRGITLNKVIQIQKDSHLMFSLFFGSQFNLFDLRLIWNT